MDTLNQLFAFVLRLFLAVVGAIFVLGLMALAVVFLCAAWLWSAITGQKHPVQQVWARARSTQQQVWRASGGRRARNDTAERETQKDDVLQDVTDVEDLSNKR
jgi:uncharacterized membrane protein